MKAVARKARAVERGNLFRTGGGPPVPSTSRQVEAIVDMVEEAAPAMICEISNNFDSDGAILLNMENSQSSSIEFLDMITEANEESDVNFKAISINYEGEPNVAVHSNETGHQQKVEKEQVRRPSDYVRREAALRVRYLEKREKLKLELVKTQLEVEQIKKRAALLEEQKNQVLLQKAKIDFEEAKKNRSIN
ncbi:PREDICTED: uncharacterized protein LOC108365234 [Rhagoletis zephyria]|uniref:uncharacterized protein LOC108362178 n=1 Tax=Rhagoletis zephyria TaxID=28612 RepID=UPI000811A370|nr:PREDICTED: uncharacterized protein LOC108362178 [Rhagoletis zephyria]XP_017474710.1 PREDICTED: uncharacterized protein LOC108365234 [Rhagoletis zephyria]XP_017474711.1 PREDICTED: uncharacterized protein LOC108365234 [Rhagoletis zephyria]XP_017474712.1 PREDICTED: uncharacterized protein LOC108365234 [Rhagoletis zephyria]XP_036320690.1 uncharacterized protein LOC118735162 [Rhagoletis pomonella]XP_036320691.1 uncharacterized protein LOC118735162 [Rhagoletis pomonella]